MPNAQGPNILAGLYYEFSIPLGLVNILQTVIGNSQHNPNTPDVPVQRAPREWYSQPRSGTDTTVEVLQVNFKLPLSVGHLAFQVLRVPCVVSAWYQDRNNNWVPMTDDSNSPIQINLSYSAVTNWFSYQTAVYPIVATAIQLRIVRSYDPQMGTSPYVVGIQEMLIRRNVYSIDDTTTAIEDQQDVLGNTITSYVKNWGANNVLDNNPNTFWKSFPCPDPNGVVALYLDTRDAGGNPQLIDTLYVDPVYSGNTLNLYYSNDPTQGTLIISPTVLPPDTQVNASWTLGLGMVDTSGPDLSNSQLLFPLSLGPMSSTPIWIGIEWTPDFAPSSGPPDNPILFSTTPLDGGTNEAADGQHWVVVYYDVGAGYITVEFINGTNIVSYHAALSPAFTQGVPLQIVVGWQYNPNMVFISVTAANTTSLASSTQTATFLPTLLTLDGEVGYTNFRGLMTALVVKQEPWTNGFAAFQAGASIYANPNPVQPDALGNYPSTSLDNAMLAVDWTAQQFPIGGTHESWYENKTWTPVFANYITQKGNLFLPQATSMSYLKMEFTNLTAEPYPVYDQGIAVQYDTFPVSVIQQSTSNRPGGLAGIISGLLTLGSEIATTSIGSVNWFNPSTIQNAVNAAFGVTQPPVQVVTGPGTITTSIPNTAQSAITNTYRSEQNSPWVYSRQILSPAYLAGQQLTQIGNSPTSTQTMQSTTDGTTSTQVANTFTPVTTASSSNVLPQQGKDWWLFPGANMKMPASVMQGLTGTQVVTARGPALSTRVRFTGTSIHRYTTNTVTLDAALAYFAGITEVQAYLTQYIDGNDPSSFSYTQYDPNTFVYDNINQEAAGPLTTSGSPYDLLNPNFYYPLELTYWLPVGNWYWDSQHGLGSENGQGDEPCAAIIADSLPNTLTSEPFAVNPGDEIVISAWVAYYNVSLNQGEFPVTFPFTFGSSDHFPVEFPFEFGSPPSVAGEILSISGVAYEAGADSFPYTFPWNFGTDVTFAMPTTTATFTVDTVSDMLALSGAVEYDSCTVNLGSEQGTYTLTATPASNIANWLLTGYGTLIYQPSGNIDGNLFVQLIGTYTVPGSGVDALSVVLNVGEGLTGGNIYWGGVQVNPAAGIEGTVFLDAITTSSFADVAIQVNDSGLVTSDSMWAQADPLDTNISNLALAPYVNTIPSIIPSGTWDDTFATWDSPTIDWGEPASVVAINVDPNLIYQGNRAIHFTRAAGAGEAGVLITQQTNMLAQELAQLGCTFLKPNANANQITISLRRVSDGVYIWTETFTPVVGYWYTYLSAFFELPDTTDQVYTIEFVATGDAADEMYLSDLYTNVAGIRYFLQLGGDEATLFDVTPTVYGDNPNVSTTLPVNELAFTVGIFSPNAWAYGATLTPRYLK
jgi:hypothetical protein